MKPIPIPPGAVAWMASLVALAGLAPQSSAHEPSAQAAPPREPAAQQGPGSPGGSLRRLDPTEAEQKDLSDLDDLFARDFDRERWSERLRQPDLDQRERSLDALLKRARLDPVARAFLEELARDPQAGELAWTARLALRELGSASFSLHQLLPGADPFGLEPFGPDPFAGDPFGSVQRMQQMMQELLGQEGLRSMLPHGSRPDGAMRSGRRVHVEQGPDGALVRITETVDGDESTRSYSGRSVAEILGENKELAQELEGLQLDVDPSARLDLRFGLNGGRGGPLRGLQDERFALAPQARSRPIVTDRLGVIVRPVDAVRAKELGLVDGGLVVERTVAETYAHLLGVKSGDVLLELSGTALRSEDDIVRAMRERRPDDPLELVWLDGLGQRQEKTWRPGPAPDGPR